MLNGAFAESTSSIILFEEDCPVALNFVLEILYYPEEFSAYSDIVSRTEVVVLLGKYQLSGVRSFIARMIRAEGKKLQQSLRARDKWIVREIDTLRDEVQKLQLNLQREINMRPGKTVQYKDDPPIGTRVEMPDEKNWVIARKGKITSLYKSLPSNDNGLVTRAEVSWDDGTESDNIEDHMLRYI